MPDIPAHYAWLSGLPGLPLMIRHALDAYGVVECAGADDNPTIIAWAKEVGEDVARLYRADAIPWCGLFMAVVARRAGKAPPPNPLWALSWAEFGNPAPAPALGDVLVFRRDGGGHVGLYVGEDEGAFHVLGGNQADRVCFARIARARLFAVRRPAYRWPPASAIPYRLATAGRLSTREA